MKHDPEYGWQRVGQIWNYFDAPHHAGLSSDGLRLFLAEHDDLAYMVYDIRAREIIWKVERGDDYPPLPEWIEDGHIEISEGPAKGRYRIFGIDENYPLEVDDHLGIAIQLNRDVNEIALIDLEMQQAFQWFPYEIPSAPLNKSVAASLSDDGTTIAVFVDHAVTFFRHGGPPHPEVSTLTTRYIPGLPTGWTLIGAISGWYEHPQHAGLSTDGRLFMLVEFDGMDYVVCDLATREVIWQSDWTTPHYRLTNLEDLIQDGYVEINEGSAQGRYRIFGTNEGAPLMSHPTLGIELEIDKVRSQLILRDTATQQELQRLYYRPTTDWTYASFSDDGSVIAVFVTHDVTFFGQVPDTSA